MSDTRERTAECACRDVAITLRGAPWTVYGCHCGFCQRRGSSIAVAAWYAEEQVVSIAGETDVYIGHPDAGRFEGTGLGGHKQAIEFRFCPRCGSNVYWMMPMPAGALSEEEATFIGVSVGCFNDADYPRPTSYQYVSKRVPWLEPLEAEYMYDGMPTLEQKKREIRTRSA